MTKTFLQKQLEEFDEKFPENKYYFRDEYNRPARFSTKDREDIKRFIVQFHQVLINKVEKQFIKSKTAEGFIDYLKKL